jgi:Undecaprenyl-phosphate galactose phosphotransferase WbaP
VEERPQNSVATVTFDKPAEIFVAETKRWKPAWKKRLATATLVLSDVLFALLIWEGALALQTIWGQGTLSDLAAASVVPNVVLWVGLRALLGLYPGYGLDQVEKLRRHAYAVFATVATVGVSATAFQVGDLLSRSLLVLGFLGVLLLAPPVRYLAERGTRKAGLWGKPVVILGSGEAGARLAKLLQQKWDLGYNPVAAFDFRLAFGEGPIFERPSGDHEEDLAAAADLARRQGVDTAIFAMPHTRREQLAELVGRASISFKHVLIIPNLGGVTNSAVVARDLAGTFAVEIKHNLLDPWALWVKRVMDVFGAVVGGLLISPLLVAIAILIKLDTLGPAFYGHKRLGPGETHFRCWKFRTMRPDAERLLDEYLQDYPYLRAEWEQYQKLRNDPRVTRVGRILRKTSLDELPQLWNVLLGEMSLTGPRPIVDAEVPKYGRAYELYKRIKPGMSGFWQVSGRSDTSYLERVEMDAYYVRNWSVWLDLVILARTIKIVLAGRGSY